MATKSFKKRALTLATLGILGAATPLSMATLGHNQRAVGVVEPEVPFERVVAAGGISRIDYAEKPAIYYHRSTLSLALIAFTNNEFQPVALNEHSFNSSASFILIGDSEQSASHSNEHNSTLELGIASVLDVSLFEPSAVENDSTLVVTLASDTEFGFSEQVTLSVSPNLFVSLDTASRFNLTRVGESVISVSSDLTIASDSSYEFEAQQASAEYDSQSITVAIINSEINAEFIPAIVATETSTTSRGVFSVVGIADYSFESEERNDHSHTSMNGTATMISLTDAFFERRKVKDKTLMLLLAAMYDDD